MVFDKASTLYTYINRAFFLSESQQGICSKLLHRWMCTIYDGYTIVFLAIHPSSSTSNGGGKEDI
jgi:hypothetical protein